MVADNPAELAQHALTRFGARLLIRNWRRHPADLARCVAAATVCAAAVLIARADPATTRSVSADMVQLFGHLPHAARQAIVGVLQVVALLAPAACLVWVRRDRWLELVVALSAGAAGAACAAATNGTLRDAVPASVLRGSRELSWITGSAFPSGAYLAAVAAAVTFATPSLTLAWRRTAQVAVAAVMAARIVSTVEVPLGLLADLALGIAVGAAVLVVVGGPARHPSPELVAAGLRTSGIFAEHLEPITRTRNNPGYLAVTADERLFVKVVDRDERDSDLFWRALRWLRVKGVEDDRPIGRKAAVEREALNTLMAANAGVNTSPVRAVGDLAEDGAFLATTELVGVPLSELDPAQFTDEIADAAFRQLARLQHSRIAHRWASLEHFLLCADGSVAVLDFRWAELSADDQLLATDVAELLVSTAAVLGTERTVRAAVDVFAPEHLATALPVLQPLVLSASTRSAVSADKQLLPALREALEAATGVEHYELMELDRLTLRKVISFVGLLVMGNLLLGLIADFDEIWSALRDANLVYVIPMLALMVGSYATGAIALMGAVNIRLRFVRTTVVMFAQSFLNRFIPANAGGMAMRVRYLQRNGLDVVVAASSVGLTSAATGVAQVLTATVFFAWAGSAAEQSGAFSLPDGTMVLLVVIGALVAGGVLLATAFGKRLFTKLGIQLRALLHELLKLARQPSKMLMLFGGSVLGKVCSILMLSESLHAFGYDVSFARLGAMYITATTIAAAAPTPGGVGAIEAALAAGLSGLGIAAAPAVAVVVLFRVISYWFPVLPCWLALHYVQRHEIA